MKILIPVDGSYHSDTALESVLSEPWPEDSSFCVMTVAEAMHTLTDSVFLGLGAMALQAQKALDGDIQKLLHEAADQLRVKFGADKVTEEFQEGIAADHIINTAQRWKADLIVMGSHGKGGYNDPTLSGYDYATLRGYNYAALGSICIKVMTHAPCSVRIVHYLSSPSLEKKMAAHAPLVTSRLLLALDRSARSKLVINSVLNRPWAEGTVAQVITVAETRSMVSHSRFFKAPEISQTEKAIYEAEKTEAEKLVQGAGEQLENKFGQGKVTYHALEGNARSLILQIAQDWPADLIVLGAHGHDKSLLEHVVGSVARAVVMNASCSVEIVR